MIDASKQRPSSSTPSTQRSRRRIRGNACHPIFPTRRRAADGLSPPARRPAAWRRSRIAITGNRSDLPGPPRRDRRHTARLRRGGRLIPVSRPATPYPIRPASRPPCGPSRSPNPPAPRISCWFSCRAAARPTGSRPPGALTLEREAGHHPCPSALGRAHRRDQHGAQTPLPHQGRAARPAAAPAPLLTLAISDVPHDDPAVIASRPDGAGPLDPRGCARHCRPRADLPAGDRPQPSWAIPRTTPETRRSGLRPGRNTESSPGRRTPSPRRRASCMAGRIRTDRARGRYRGRSPRSRPRPCAPRPAGS